MNSIAIIPARGGSKRIPRKNVRSFCGKPMIGRTIETLRASGLFAEVIVSTDDAEIARVSEKFGARVPFVRPAELSDDFTPTLPVIAHALRQLESLGHVVPDAVCCAYATAPFLRAEDLAAGWRLLTANAEARFVFSVTSYDYSIWRALRKQPGGWLQMAWPEHESTRSQDLPEMLHDAGQFYWGTRHAFLDEKGIFTAPSLPVVLPREQVHDIDTIEDWKRAELIFSALHATPAS